MDGPVFVQEREKAGKKKLQGFLTEMLSLGCVRGFKYFSSYLRGKEEMVCTVLNEPVTPRSCTPTTTEQGHILFSGELPVDQKVLASSQRTRRRSSGCGYMDVGPPPASPSEREITPVPEDSTLFLVAGYGKYSCPYVWVRSNHDRLVKVNGEEEPGKCNRDSPLRLKTTSAWNEKDVRVWEVLAELVKLNTRPAPSNPFAVDLDYFDGLDLGERVIALGAMSHLLQQVFSHGPDKAYAGLVADDLKEVTRRHLKDLRLSLKQLPQSTEESSLPKPVQAVRGHSRDQPINQGQRSYSQGYQ